MRPLTGISLVLVAAATTDVLVLGSATGSGRARRTTPAAENSVKALNECVDEHDCASRNGKARARCYAKCLRALQADSDDDDELEGKFFGGFGSYTMMPGYYKGKPCSSCDSMGGLLQVDACKKGCTPGKSADPEGKFFGNFGFGGIGGLTMMPEYYKGKPCSYCDSIAGWMQVEVCKKGCTPGKSADTGDDY